MRIILMHNPEAGRGEHSAKELMKSLEKAGHDAIYQSTKKKDYEKVLSRPADLVLAAGGDGTVGKVACQLLGRGIPLSVLPLGTANNLAYSLGFDASSEDLISRLESGQRRSFDVGLATGPWGKRHFFEGAGAGLLPDYLRALKSSGKKAKKAIESSSSKEEEIAHHVSLLRELLPDYPNRDWQISLDGKDVSGRYVLLEALNIRSVGPMLALAPKADTGDGRFDFVAVREADRAVFSDYLNARLVGDEIEFPIPARRFHRLRIFWEESTLHFDDKLWPSKYARPPKPSEIEISVEPSALEILLPARDLPPR
jgi:diacylglycerol kinase (ATP)